LRELAGNVDCRGKMRQGEGAAIGLQRPWRPGWWMGSNSVISSPACRLQAAANSYSFCSSFSSLSFVLWPRGFTVKTGQDA
jgi:hypothetical protein